MEGMKEQKAYGQETSHEQIAKDRNTGFSEKISDTAHSIGQKAADMGTKVSEAFSGLAGHEKGHYDSELSGATGFMPGRNLPEGKDLHMVGGIGESVKRELHESAVDKQQHAPEAISELEHHDRGLGLGFGDQIQGQIGLTNVRPTLEHQERGLGFGDQFHAQTDLGGFMPGRNLPEGQDLHTIGGIGESAKRELHESAVDKAQHAPEAISGLERDLGDLKLQGHTDLARGQEIKNEGGIMESIKSTAAVAATKASESIQSAAAVVGTKASDTAGSVKDTVVEKTHQLLPQIQEGMVNAGHSAYNTTANVLHVAKDKVLEVGAKAKEMVVGASERSSERKGSVPDASLQFPSAMPNEGFPLDKGVLEKDRVFEKGTFEQDKGLATYEKTTIEKTTFDQDKGLNLQKDELHRTTQASRFD